MGPLKMFLKNIGDLSQYTRCTEIDTVGADFILVCKHITLIYIELQSCAYAYTFLQMMLVIYLCVLTYSVQIKYSPGASIAIRKCPYQAPPCGL